MLCVRICERKNVACDQKLVLDKNCCLWQLLMKIHKEQSSPNHICNENCCLWRLLFVTKTCWWRKLLLVIQRKVLFGLIFVRNSVDSTCFCSQQTTFSITNSNFCLKQQLLVSCITYNMFWWQTTIIRHKKHFHNNFSIVVCDKQLLFAFENMFEPKFAVCEDLWRKNVACDQKLVLDKNCCLWRLLMKIHKEQSSPNHICNENCCLWRLLFVTKTCWWRKLLLVIQRKVLFGLIFVRNSDFRYTHVFVHNKQHSPLPTAIFVSNNNYWSHASHTTCFGDKQQLFAIRNIFTTIFQLSFVTNNCCLHSNTCLNRNLLCVRICERKNVACDQKLVLDKNCCLWRLLMKIHKEQSSPNHICNENCCLWRLLFVTKTCGGANCCWWSSGKCCLA